MNVFTGEMSAEQTRMNELYTTLKAWSDAYYNDDAPLATDEEYDRLMRELKQLEAEHPYWDCSDLHLVQTDWKKWKSSIPEKMRYGCV